MAMGASCDARYFSFNLTVRIDRMKELKKEIELVSLRCVLLSNLFGFSAKNKKN